MRKLLLLMSLFVFVAPIATLAQSGFDGTWKINTRKAQPSKKPQILLLQDGMFSCKTCTPAYTVKADGEFHKFTGSPYFDMISAKAEDGGRKVVASEKKDGKVVATITVSLSADGNTLNSVFTDSSDTNSDPVTGTAKFTRSAAGPAGSEPISGSWVAASYTQSDNASTFALKVEGDTLTMTNPTGQSYTAKLDGTEAPYKGDPGVTSVSVKRISKNAIEETDKRNGKAIFILTMTVAPDGKSMRLTEHNLRSGEIGHDTAYKQ